jgi:hypothetical protein
MGVFIYCGRIPLCEHLKSQWAFFHCRWPFLISGVFPISLAFLISVGVFNRLMIVWRIPSCWAFLFPRLPNSFLLGVFISSVAEFLLAGRFYSLGCRIPSCWAFLFPLWPNLSTVGVFIFSVGVLHFIVGVFLQKK